MLSCPSPINVLSHVLKQHKTSFAELAHSKKSSVKNRSVVNNNKEDPTLSHLFQNTSPVQKKVPLQQNETLITSTTTKESGSAGDSKTVGIPPFGKNIKDVISIPYTHLIPLAYDFGLGEETSVPRGNPCGIDRNPTLVGVR